MIPLDPVYLKTVTDDIKKQIAIKKKIALKLVKKKKYIQRSLEIYCSAKDSKVLDMLYKKAKE